MKNWIKTKTVGIIGYGFLGQAFEYSFSAKSNIMINDIAHEIDNVKFFSKEDIVDKADCLFVAVPGPYSLSKGYIHDIVDNVFTELDNAAKKLNKKPLIVTKNAIPPTIVDNMVLKFKNIRLVVSPEYLAGKTSVEDQIHSGIWILGGNRQDCEEVMDLVKNHSVMYSRVWNTLKVGFCSAVDAALIKYAENHFLALKCVFMSKYYQIHEEIKTEDSVDFNEWLRLWQLDHRMGQYPYKIPYEGELGYDSHCIWKDTKAIKDEAEFLGLDIEFFSDIEKENLKLRSNLEDPYWRARKTEGGIID